MSAALSRHFREEIKYVQEQITYARDSMEWFRGLGTRCRRRPGGEKTAAICAELVAGFNEELKELQQELAAVREKFSDVCIGDAEDHQT